VKSANISEDTGEEVEIRPPVGRWVWLAVGFIAGLGVSALFAFPQPEPPLTDATAASTREPDPARTAEAAVGVEASVPGFPDGLVTITRADGLSLRLTVWPVAGPLYHRAVNFGAQRPPTPTHFDVSGRRVATSIANPGSSSGVLFAGNPETAAVVATNVAGYAWHDADPGTIAYTSLQQGELQLWVTANPLAAPELQFSGFGLGGDLRAWGDWGFAFQKEDEVVLVSSAGEITDFLRGDLLGTDRDGSLVLAVDERIMITAAAGDILELSAPSQIGSAVNARFSPNGQTVAILGGEGVITASVASGEILTETPGRLGLPVLAWSSDSRFVAFPAFRGVLILDATTGRMTQVMRDLTITGLATIPPSPAGSDAG
jgi:hypothetical protein